MAWSDAARAAALEARRRHTQHRSGQDPQTTRDGGTPGLRKFNNRFIDDPQYRTFIARTLRAQRKSKVQIYHYDDVMPLADRARASTLYRNLMKQARLARAAGHSQFNPKGVSQKQFNNMLDAKAVREGRQLSPALRKSRAAEQRAADKFKPKKK